MSSCSAFNSAAATGVSHALISVDCHVDAAVANAYGRLFGGGGVFSLVLTALLTLYVGFIALGFMTGRTRLSLAGLTPRILAIGLVLTFATSWPAYHAMAYGFLVGGPEEILRQLSGPTAGARGFAFRLDALFDRFADIAKALGDSTPGASKALGPLAGPQMASALVWLSGLLLLLGTAGALVLTRILLALLLALGPVFVVLALFKSTRGLFEGWLRTAVMFALAPLLTVLAGSGAVALLSPLVDVIADDPASAVADLRPVLELFMGAVVYVGLMAMLLWTCASLVRNWRVFGEDAEREPAVTDILQQMTAASASFAPTTLSPASIEPRAAQVITALDRAATTGAGADEAARIAQAVAVRVDAVQTVSTSRDNDARRRNAGLGQRYRPQAASLAKPVSGLVK
ncbi:type IV secretion system protein [Caulobacter sp. SL161]|uniref:type IV secretion system protein n=1 Tax=Caulobacter sp. SL161 TaxID=2995156 RepID=UPI0022742D71|nr:type IV secretion system protein [Caulobacter sp. SL161]MCY1647470.1 type IV secretion system protein [Caulobacter sp. SL161]